MRRLARRPRLLAVHQLHQYAVRGRWVYESDHRTVGARSWGLVDHPDSGCQQLLDSSVQVFHTECQVVNPLSSLLQELRHGPIWIRWLQHLDLAVANPKHRYLKGVADLFRAVNLEAQQLIEGGRSRAVA